eukprot:1798781-Rhodomonas_salina.1
MLQLHVDMFCLPALLPSFLNRTLASALMPDSAEGVLKLTSQHTAVRGSGRYRVADGQQQDASLCTCCAGLWARRRLRPPCG